MHQTPGVKILVIGDAEPKEFVSCDSDGKMYRTVVEKESFLNKYIGNYEKNHFFPVNPNNN